MNLIFKVNKFKQQLISSLLLLGLTGLISINCFAVESDVEDVAFDDKPLDYALILPD